jgi:hypothetical protein
VPRAWLPTWAAGAPWSRTWLYATFPSSSAPSSAVASC